MEEIGNITRREEGKDEEGSYYYIYIYGLYMIKR
jgi:hypothetical protein